MENELIRRSDAAKVFEGLLESPYANEEDLFSHGVKDALQLARDMMRNRVPKQLSIPAVDAVEVRHSNWGQEPTVAECMNCGALFPAFLRFHEWCPNCGARMDGEENTMRLIDADELLAHRFVGVVGEEEKWSYMVGWNTAIEAVVENAPTIDAVEVVHAYWKRVHDDVCYWSECSHCGGEMPLNRYRREWESAVCPSCGARMDGRREDGDA